MFEKVESPDQATFRGYTSWPFKKMELGEVLRLPANTEEEKKFAFIAQQRAGGYSKHSKKNFITRTKKTDEGVYLYIRRVE